MNKQLNIIERFEIAFLAMYRIETCHPVRVWLAPIDYALLRSEAYRASKGRMVQIHTLQDLPVRRDPFGQPSRIVAHDGLIIKI